MKNVALFSALLKLLMNIEKTEQEDKKLRNTGFADG